eukprot:jgi/Bigna1/65620/fgenesh1_kg.119_\
MGKTAKGYGKKILKGVTLNSRDDNRAPPHWINLTLGCRISQCYMISRWRSNVRLGLRATHPVRDISRTTTIEARRIKPTRPSVENFVEDAA